MLKNINKSNRGFLQVIIIIFIAVVILAIFGINPKAIWTNYALPILEFIWNVFLAILGFVVDLGVKLANKLNI